MNIDEKNYNSIIENLLADKFIYSTSEAEKVLTNILLEEEESYLYKSVEEIPFENVIKKKKRKSVNIDKKEFKVEWKNVAIKNIRKGFEGEKYVIQIEKNRLIELGRNDLAEKIKWVAQEDDSIGYDIISYDIDEYGKEKEIYIEVKTTDGSEDSEFFMSQNEIEHFMANKDNYFIYRVFNLNKDKIKFFKISWKDFIDCFKYEPSTYRVKLIKKTNISDEN